MGYLDQFVFTLLLAITGVSAGEYCHDYYRSSDYWSDNNDKYCTYGCCGYNNTECCDAGVGLIVGMIVLSILVVSVIIAVICCCRRRRAAMGQVIRNNQGMPPGGVVITTSNQSNMMYNTQAYPPGAYQPPPYAMGQQYPQAAASPMGQQYPPAAMGQQYPPAAMGQQYPPGATASHTVQQYSSQPTADKQLKSSAPPANLYDNPDAASGHDYTALYNTSPPPYSQVTEDYTSAYSK